MQSSAQNGDRGMSQNGDASKGNDVHIDGMEDMEETNGDSAQIKSEDSIAGGDDQDSVNNELERFEELEPLETHEVASDYKRANKVKFVDMCKRFELLWEQKSKPPGQRQSQDERLKCLLPDDLFRYLKGGDPFPILRLMMPRIDTSRPKNGMMEKVIANAWSQALGLMKQSAAHRKLLNYSDPTIAGHTAAGDLSMAVKEVVEMYYSNTPSKITVGRVNELLDELAEIKRGDPRQAEQSQRQTHDWRQGSKKYKAPNKSKMRADWVSKLLQMQLSPLEHKWIVRIIMGKMDIGILETSILRYYSPYAEELYSSNNSLKRLCATLSDPEWVRRRNERAQREEDEMAEDMRRNHMPRCRTEALLGNTLAPMLAQRTSFDKALTDISARHRTYAKNMSGNDVGANSLALKFPTFICEVKLDGERMLAHVNRGIVTMQTRNSKWYSNLYSPVLGPAIRRAISKYDVDLILDGEVISWDDERQEIIPFGSNRTVANARREWCARHGRLDKRDQKLHENQEDINIMELANGYRSTREPVQGATGEVEQGSACWLKFIVFDVLYVGGPDAGTLMSKAFPGGSKVTPGSIINLNGFQRKHILYNLIEPQVNEVEIVPSLVVRCNGSSENALSYFSATDPSKESGIFSSQLDSIESALAGDIPDREQLETQCRKSRSDTEISRRRAVAMGQFYKDIVEQRGLEGLVFKDLAAPYYLGYESRRLRYWFKLKPDYNNTSMASDLDFVVLGAYYATGLAKSGLLNAFLMGCTDPDSPGKFMTVCKVSGGGTTRQKLEGMLEHTEYSIGPFTDNPSYGKWFKEVEHGKSMPDFISKRSHQQKSNGKGWLCMKTKYPDLWIKPEDSVVFTLNAAELTASDEFSAGVSLRFPQIERVRIESADGDVKSAHEVESVDTLHQLFRQMSQQRSEGSTGLEFQAGSPSRPSASATETPFLTVEEEYGKRTKAKRAQKVTKGTEPEPVPTKDTVDKVESSALTGLTFIVLEGNYSLDKDSLDAEQAKEEGWLDQALTVKEREDVIKFIVKHSGTCKQSLSMDADYILGGRIDDARVVTYKASLEIASDPRNWSKTKEGKELQKLYQLGGILKWTYVFSSVRRWIDAVGCIKLEEGVDQLPATSSVTQLPRPTRYDYLVLGDPARLGQDADVFGIQLSKDINMVDFKRALEEVKRSKRMESEEQSTPKRAKLKDQLEAVGGSHIPWQYAAVHSLEPCNRWVLGGDIGKLWKYASGDNGDSRPTVMYPDLFQDDLGMQSQKEVLREVLAGNYSSRWDDLSPAAQNSDVASSLPLARAMGAQITSHLHDGVSHVICRIKPPNDEINWERNAFEPEMFEDPNQAARMHGRLLELHPDGGKDATVVFVSTNWIRKLFDEAHAG